VDTFTTIVDRVKEKKADYTRYAFDALEMAALNTFFDLAQEYDGLENLHLISVTVPDVFFGIQSTLYTVHPETQAIVSAADSHFGLQIRGNPPPEHIQLTQKPYYQDQVYVVPIHGKKTPSSRILLHRAHEVIGVFAVSRPEGFEETEIFFVEKYVNRIGYNLYNKSLAEQNIQHLKFVNNLVADIEHNIIVPNLRYKYYLKKIRKFLNLNKEIENDLSSMLDEVKTVKPELYGRLSEIVEQMVVINRATFDEQEKIDQHFKHTSLFLESLLRPDHFLYGQYMLKKTSCNLWQDIVLPQVERYTDTFARKGIRTQDIADPPEEDIEIKVDKGLMAQVVANLLSNAAKYTQSIMDKEGKTRKIVRCGATKLHDFFGYGHHAVRFHVESSGAPIDETDSTQVFEEGFRLSHAGVTEGTGHGLHFVKNVIEVHGGVVGHTPKEQGNEFFFVIPQ